MRKPLIGLSLVLLIVMAQLIATAPTRKSLRTQLNPHYVRAMAAYKRLEGKLPREELRAITTIGILNGAKQTEQIMEQHLIEVVKDLVMHTDAQDTEALVPKLTKIEKQLQRDQRALQILTSAMELATHEKDLQTFKKEMQQTLQEVQKQSEQVTTEAPKGNRTDEETTAALQDDNVGARVAALRQNILKQVNTMREVVEQKIEHTLDYLIEAADDDGLLAKASKKVLHKRDTSESHEEMAEVRMINSILSEADFRHNLVQDHLEKRKDEFDTLDDDFEFNVDKEIANQSSKPTTTKAPTPSTSLRATTSMASGRAKSSTKPVTTTEPNQLAKQELDDDDDDNSLGATSGTGGGGGGGGVLVGLISGLSGGEGGSDVGALLGALTGLVSTLFGPGGLDVESLISTATSLLSGLLAGNKNFGTVLGIYVGTAFDGLSGGGGAINNGQFLGNFLGTVVAYLSADPEDDEQPPKPFIFAQNLLSSFREAKNRNINGENSEENEERRHDHQKGGAASGGGGHGAGSKGGGSDSGGFIKHIVSHLVSSAVSFILNASVGASGGASHASSGHFAGGSSHSKPSTVGHGVKSS